MHLARAEKLQPIHVQSMRAALFTGGDLEIHPVELFSDEEINWAEAAALTELIPPVPSPGWLWHNPKTVVTAPTWGGSLEAVHWTLAADRWVRPVEDYAGCVLLLETSEEMPSAEQVFRMLRDAGERGLLEQFPAVLVAAAKATWLEDPRPPERRQQYRDEQRAAILRALDDYHPAAMVVFGVDFGHTDPQWILPYGGRITVDGPARRITAHF